MSDKPTPVEMLSCARRELAMRRTMYPRWVAADKMMQHISDKEIACMQAIVELITEHEMKSRQHDLFSSPYTEPIR